MDIVTYQLIKEDFPAEWFPISNTVILFRGVNKARSTLLAIETKPAVSTTYIASLFYCDSFKPPLNDVEM